MAFTKKAMSKTKKVYIYGGGGIVAFLVFWQALIGIYGGSMTDWNNQTIDPLKIIKCAGNSLEPCTQDIRICADQWSYAISKTVNIQLNDSTASWSLKKKDTLGRLRSFNLSGKTLTNGTCWDLLLEVKKPMDRTVKWGISFGANTLDPVFEGYNPDDFFVKLISNKGDLTQGEAIFEVQNPTSFPVTIDSKKLKFVFNYIQQPITNYLIYYNSTESRTVVTYSHSCISKVDVITNKSGVFEITNYVCTPKEDEKIETYEVYNPFDSLTINPGESYKIKLVAYWKAKLGKNQIEWVPSINISETTFIQSKWAWWDNEWSRRKQLNFTGTGTVDYQAFGNVTFEPDMKADFGDIRFTSSADAEIPYWIEGKADSGYADVWIKGNFTTTNVTQAYMYYGNGGVSTTSNINNTMIDGDIFDGAAVDTIRWTVTNDAGVTPAMITQNDKTVLNISNNGLTGNQLRGLMSTRSYSAPVIIEFLMNRTKEAHASENCWRVKTRMNALANDESENATGIICSGGAYSNQARIITTANGSSTAAETYVGTDATWIKYKINYTKSRADFVTDGTVRNNSVTNIPTAPGNISFQAGDIYDLYIDYAFVRAYNESDTIVASFGAEESSVANTVIEAIRVNLTAKEGTTAYRNSTLYCNGTLVDNQSTTLKAYWKLYNGTAVYASGVASNVPNGTMRNFYNLTPNKARKNENWSFELKGDDGTNGTAVNSTLQIANSRPLILLVAPTNTTEGDTNVTNTFNYVDIDGDKDKCTRELSGTNSTLVSCANTSFTANHGSYTVKMHINDTQLLSSFSASIGFSVDTIAPTVSLVTPSNTTYGGNNMTLTFNYNETNVDKCKRELDGVNTTMVSCGNTTFTTTHGHHKIKIYMNDTLGKIGNSSLVEYQSDLVAPVVVIQQPTNKTYRNIPIDLNWTISDINGISYASYELDGQTNVSLIQSGYIYDLTSSDSNNWVNTTSIYAMDASGTSSIYFAGVAGMFGMYNTTNGITSNLSGTAGTGPFGNFFRSIESIDAIDVYNKTHVFIGGHAGLFAVYNKATNITSNLTGAISAWAGLTNIYAIWAKNNTAVYIGTAGGKFGVYNPVANTSLSLVVESIGNIIQEIKGYNDTNIYIVGDGGSYWKYNQLTNITTSLINTDIGNWVEDKALYGIIPYNDTSVFIAGVDGRFGVYNPFTNITLQLMESDTDDWIAAKEIFGLSSFGSTSKIYLVGSEGMFGVYNPATNVTSSLSTLDANDWIGASTLISICNFSSTTAYLGGGSGKFGYYVDATSTTNTTFNISTGGPHRVKVYGNDTLGNNNFSATINFTYISLLIDVNLTTNSYTLNMTGNTAYNATPINQTSTKGILNITNLNSGGPVNVTVQWQTAISSCITNFLLNTTNSRGTLNVTTTPQLIKVNLANNASQLIWNFVDLNNCTVGAINSTLNFTAV